MTRIRRILACAPLLGALGLAQAQDPMGNAEPRLLSAQPRYARLTDTFLPPPVVVGGEDGTAPAPAAVGEPAAVPFPEIVHQSASVGELTEVPCECVATAPPGPLRRFWHHRAKPCLQATHWGYPEEFGGRPFGSFAQMAVDAQIGNGYAAQLTLYRYDFSTLDGRPSDRLNARGRARLVRLAEILAMTPHPLVIEFDELHPPMNDARRRHVLAHLQDRLGSIDDSRVVVAAPPTLGLSAEEAVGIHQNLLKQTQGAAAGGNESSMSSGGGTTSTPQFGAGLQGGTSSGSY